MGVWLAMDSIRSSWTHTFVTDRVTFGLKREDRAVLTSVLPLAGANPVLIFAGIWNAVNTIARARATATVAYGRTRPIIDVTAISAEVSVTDTCA
jgi:hypothetical protein